MQKTYDCKSKTKGWRNAERARKLLRLKQKDYIMPKELENYVQKTLMNAIVSCSSPICC